MKQYLLSVYQPGETPPPDVDMDEVRRDVQAFHEELEAADAWVFSGGLHPPGTATVLRPRGGEVLTTDGPYLEGKEFIGGFTVIRAPDLDSALAWGRKAALATTLPVEVRPFQDDSGK
jgi:hypothetical protein